MKRNYLASKLLTISLLAITLLFSQCKKDELLSDVEPKPETLTGLQNSDLIAATSAPSGSYNIQNSLPSGYVKDGTKDYTSYIQAALNKYSNIVFPGFPIMVNDNGLIVGSNKTITFLDGSKLVLKPTSKSSYTILKVDRATNVTLIDPYVVGDRNKHIGTSGEHGTGIGIYSSSDVTVVNPTAIDCWGDGMYVGRYTTVNKNIVITNAFLKNNRRDGISITSVDGLKLDKCYAGYNQGTLPMAGINFEPNTINDEIKNVSITDAVTEHNGAIGMQFTVGDLIASGSKSISIDVFNHQDVSSKRFALKFSAYKKDTYTGNLSGYININNPVWKKYEEKPMYFSMLGVPNVKATINNPKLTSITGALLTNTETLTALQKCYRYEAKATISFTAVTTPILNETVEPIASDVAFAVNAGGGSFKASNGITYDADKNFSKGNVYKSAKSIGNTSDDLLYQSERYGTFSYAVPLVNGTYEITFKMSELYHNASSRRQFDVLAENSVIISNLDIFNLAGSNTAYDIVKTVSVNDGILNLNFKTDIDQAKVSAFHIIKK